MEKEQEIQEQKTEEQLTIDLVAMIDEKLERMLETVTLPDEDYVWKPLEYNPNSSTKEFSTYQLADMRKKSFDMFNIDSSIAQFINILNSGTFGTGLQKPNSEDKTTQSIIDLIWDNKDNQRFIFSALSMRDLNTKLILNGELFLVLSVSDNSKGVRITDIDPAEITDVIFDPNDKTKPVSYKREYKKKTYNYNKNAYEYSDTIIEYYKDYNVNEEIPKTVKDKYIYHIKVNSVGSRGIPEVNRCYHWVRAHSKALSNAMTLSAALAMFAWRKKITTKSSAAIASAVSKINTATPSVGAMHLGNDAVALDAVNIPTGGISNLEAAIRQSFLESIRSLGFGEHYFGQADTGNLATASAMELPAIWKIEDRQMIWRSIIVNILEFALFRNGIENVDIFLEFPPAKRLDTSETKSAIDAIIAAHSEGLISDIDAVREVYETFNIKFDGDLTGFNLNPVQQTQ